MPVFPATVQITELTPGVGNWIVPLLLHAAFIVHPKVRKKEPEKHNHFDKMTSSSCRERQLLRVHIMIHAALNKAMFELLQKRVYNPRGQLHGNKASPHSSTSTPLLKALIIAFEFTNFTGLHLRQLYHRLVFAPTTHSGSAEMEPIINFDPLNHAARSPFTTVIIGIMLSMALATFYALSVIYQHLKQGTEWKRSLDFSNIPALPFFDITNAGLHPYRPWKAGKYHMTMGIRKMPEAEWLRLDNVYTKEQGLRKHLLETKRNEVLQYLPGSEEACEEALECIVGFLIARYPSHFQLLKEKPDYLHNLITGQIFKITAPYELHPLEIGAQLVMEDINIMLEDAENYNLQASFSMAPAGWYVYPRRSLPLI